MIKLLPFRHPDIPRLINWVSSPKMLMQFAGPDFIFPLTAEQLIRHLGNPNQQIFKVFAEETNEIIGHAEIRFQDDSTAMLCRLLIGDEKFRGKGLGQLLTKKLLDIAYEKNSVQRVELNVFDWNKAAVRCYEKCGFKFNLDKTKQRIVDGETWIAKNMFIERSHYFSLNH